MEVDQAEVAAAVAVAVAVVGKLVSADRSGQPSAFDGVRLANTADAFAPAAALALSSVFAVADTSAASSAAYHASPFRGGRSAVSTAGSTDLAERDAC